jgi:ubiquitin carboxyl-terminal hydrolase 9/24
LEITNELKKFAGDESVGYDLAKLIFDFLFLLPKLENKDDMNPKCKRKTTRKKAFNLLITLCSNCDENYSLLLDELYEQREALMKSEILSKSKSSDMDASVGMRSSTGYVGLKNFGCTCYMNSILQ